MKFIIFCFICTFSCISCIKKKKYKEIQKIESQREEIQEEPIYLINLPDTISIGVPISFEIKLLYPIRIEKEYFSHLILSDSLEITLENILGKTRNSPKLDLNYDITELQINHWEIHRTFNEKGNFVVKGGIFVHTMEFENSQNDSTKVTFKQFIVPIRRKVYIR